MVERQYAHDKIDMKVNPLLHDFWVKIVTAASVFFAPIQGVLISIIVLIVADAVTGIMASYKRGIKFSSSRLAKSLTKLLFYNILIIVTHVVHVNLTPHLPLVDVAIYFIVFYEFSSFLENIGIITERDVFSWFREMLNKLKPGSNGKEEEDKGATEPKDNPEDREQ